MFVDLVICLLVCVFVLCTVDGFAAFVVLDIYLIIIGSVICLLIWLFVCWFVYLFIYVLIQLIIAVKQVA